MGGLFKWGQPFKPDNPINDLLSLESEVTTPERVQSAYEVLQVILGRVRQGLASGISSPREKLKLVYDVMRSIGITFEKQNDSSFSGGLVEKRLDCDTSSFVVMAIAHEMGWPAYPVIAPSHLFVRWDDRKGTLFNMDFGNSYTDNYYENYFGIPDLPLEKGVYLRNLNREEVEGLFLSNRGVVKYDQGDLQGALSDYNKALELNPGDAEAYNNRGVVKYERGDLEGATKDFDRAIELDPRLSR